MHDRDHARRARTLRLVLVAVPALALLVAVALRDTTAALAVAGLGAVLVGFVALVAGGVGATRARSRRGAAAVLAVGGAGLFLGGTAFGAPATGASEALRAAALSGSASLSAAAPARPLATTALTALPVKGSAPMTGYQRTERFGAAWLDVDRNGCDTRDDVLRRDLTDATGTRCTVLSGVLHDPYTGRTIDFRRGERTSAAVQIDHVVPLADAWRTGAQQLPQARRVALANDPLNLFAVDGPTNTQKSDGDAATWLPKRKAFRCTYVAHQIAVKRAYGLWITKAEGAAMRRVLSACPQQTLPGTAASGPAAASAATAASSAPTASSTARASGAVVHPGSYCSSEGARGRTAAGTAMRCSSRGSGDRPRWRSAA